MKNYITPLLVTPLAAAVLLACSSAPSTAAQPASQENAQVSAQTPAASPALPLQSAAPVNPFPGAAPLPAGADTAIFAGGCFWCVESDFEKLTGVYEVISGYTGGDLQSPTYRNHGQHVEGAKVIFDPNVISYDQLLEFYWPHVDPTDNGGQFCDRGNAYIPVIYARPDQTAQAAASKAAIEESKPFADPIVVPILPAKTFWEAEDYHQDYYKKKPRRYKFYRNGCGRDKRLQSLWGP